MSAEARKSCSRCGVPLRPGWFGSVCPRCMLSVALETDREEGDENRDGLAEAALGSDLPAIPAHLERLGGYLLIEELGRGGMGIVFEARQLTLNRMDYIEGRSLAEVIAERGARPITCRRNWRRTGPWFWL